MPTQPVTIVGIMTWAGDETPAHPIAPGGPPPTVWPGPGYPPYVDVGLPGPQPGLGYPSHPIYYPPQVSHPIALPPAPTEPPADGAAKPPPPEGGWGYSPDYGWGWFPPGGKPLPGK